jgi:biopolymer transport protein ExbB/TolQ
MANKKFFLLWLFYINSVLGLIIIASFFGIFQIGFVYDKSYLSYVIFAWWAIAEAVFATNLWNQSREFSMLSQFREQLQQTKDLDLVMLEPKFKGSLVQSHVNYIRQRYFNSKQPVDQNQLIAALERRLMNLNSFGWLASNLMVFLGLLGTVIGIVLTFYPFIDNNTAIDIARIQSHLSSIFSGVGAAFFPSIYSAIFCIFILISDRISNNSTYRLLNELATFSETEILIYVEKRSNNAQ